MRCGACGAGGVWIPGGRFGRFTGGRFGVWESFFCENHKTRRCDTLYGYIFLNVTYFMSY